MKQVGKWKFRKTLFFAVLKVDSWLELARCISGSGFVGKS